MARQKEKIRERKIQRKSKKERYREKEKRKEGQRERYTEKKNKKTKIETKRPRLRAREIKKGRGIERGKNIARKRLLVRKQNLQIVIFSSRSEKRVLCLLHA